MFTKFFRCAVYISVIFLSLVCYVQAQNQKQVSQKSAAKTKSKITLLADKPSVYITFEKLGKWQPLRDGEKGEGIVLRLHNNIQYSMRFCSFGISDGEQLTFLQKDSDLGLNYEVELTNPSKFDGTERDLPVGYLVGGLCHYYTLEAGKSVVFSVPAEHLVKGLSIKVPFKYEWEKESENNPTHFVYFNSASIPKK